MTRAKRRKGRQRKKRSMGTGKETRGKGGSNPSKHFPVSGSECDVKNNN